MTAQDPDGRRPPRARGDFPHRRLAAVLAALVVLGGVTAGIVATVIEGPTIGGTFAFLNNVVLKPFPIITTVPLGAPGNPNVYAQPNPPSGYSG